MINLDIATAASCNAAKWRNRKTTWDEIAETLSQTERTKETVKQYASYTKDRQDEIKDVGGFVGGRLMAGVAKIKGKDVEFKPPFGWRRKGFVEYRQLVALDVDFGSVDTWLDFREFGFAGLFYTTHKHTPDNPRLRIVFPLDRPVSPDEYECIARVVASWLDIEVFDDTTYQPTRLMYYPSTSKDGEFLYDKSEGDIICADDVLADVFDDISSWPTSSREAAVVRHTSGDVEDPEAKPGIVGAFCRSFNIDDAIAEFLDGVYAPCEELGEDRYSFVAGSTSGGLVVYNDRKHAYSHHNTDPAGQKLCNAFDLVRLHKFGDLDEKIKEDTDPTKYPSYKAMAEFAGNLKEVKKEIVRERKENSASDYDEIEKRAVKVAYNDDWVMDLETEGKQAKIKNTINNAFIILTNDENLRGRFGFNEFEHREVIVKPLPWDKKGERYPRPFVDADDAEIRLYMERCYNLTGAAKITDALTVCVRANSYHPIKNYLAACEWDGVHRLGTLLIDTLGAPDTMLTRTITEKFFIAAIARIYRPGIKFDNILTIIGEQGIGKSTLLDLMGREWFSDSFTSVEGNKALEALQGAWIIEIGEMSGLRKAEVQAVKQFISKREDRYRVAYGKRLDYFPRTVVFAATSNEDDPLRDATGNRRYWVINTKGGKPTTNVWDYMTPDIVAQLWGEAKKLYEMGETLHLNTDLEAEARTIQDAHIEQDDRQGLIIEYLEHLLPKNWDAMEPYARRQWLKEDTNVGTVSRTHVCCLEIWVECLGKQAEDITRRDSYEIARIMKGLHEWEGAKAIRVKYYGLQKQYVFKGLVTLVTPGNRG